MLFLVIIVIGIASGWAAAILLRRRLTWAQTFAVGLAGSFVGGLLASLIAGDGIELRMSGFLGSFVGAVVLLALSGLFFGSKRRR